MDLSTYLQIIIYVPTCIFKWIEDRHNSIELIFNGIADMYMYKPSGSWLLTSFFNVAYFCPALTENYVDIWKISYCDILAKLYIDKSTRILKSGSRFYTFKLQKCFSDRFKPRRCNISTSNRAEKALYPQSILCLTCSRSYVSYTSKLSYRKMLLAC